MTTITEPPRTASTSPDPEFSGPRKGAELKPILASWLKDLGKFTEKVADAGKRAAHSTAWHVIHSPLHAWGVLARVPFGFGRVVEAVGGWVMYSEATPLRRQAIASNDPATWAKLVKERKEHIHRRWIGLLVMAVLVLISLFLVRWLVPGWEIPHGWGLPYAELLPGWAFPGWVVTPLWTITGLVLLALGVHGKPVDKPLIKRATDASGNPPLRPELILRALCSLGVGKMNRPEDIRVLSDLTREGTVGVSIELELPEGVTASEVMERRNKLSAGLRRPIGTVWPSVGKRHEAHLVLYVSDGDMSTARQKPWPLRAHGGVDVFRPAPAFTDQRGRWVDLTLAYTSGVIGAVPRVGKKDVRPAGVAAHRRPGRAGHRVRLRPQGHR